MLESEYERRQDKFFQRLIIVAIGILAVLVISVTGCVP